MVLDPADTLDEELEQQEAIAAVAPSGAGRRGWMRVQDSAKQIASRVARVDQGAIGDLLRCVAESARVRQQVSDVNPVPRRWHFGTVATDRVVQRDFVVFDQQHDGQCLEECH